MRRGEDKLTVVAVFENHINRGSHNKRVTGDMEGLQNFAINYGKYNVGHKTFKRKKSLKVSRTVVIRDFERSWDIMLDI